MQGVPTRYPSMPDIVGDDWLVEFATLETRERGFARRRRSEQLQYLRALYLKAFQKLGYGHIQPRDLPRPFRQRIAQQLEVDEGLAKVLTINLSLRTKLLRDIRAFCGVRRHTRARAKDIEDWLLSGLAGREGDVAVLVNAAIDRYRQQNIELPKLPVISALAQRALKGANDALTQRLSKAIRGPQRDKLLSLVDKNNVGELERFKAATRAASTHALRLELERLERLRTYIPGDEALGLVSKRKQVEMASLVRRYNTAELRDLSVARRVAVLACFVAVRQRELLDDLTQMFLEVWKEAIHEAKRFADTEHQDRKNEHERNAKVLRALVEIIRSSPDAETLWQAVHAYKDYDLELLWSELESSKSWSSSFYEKLENYYSAMRRFLPQWYASMPLTSTTASDSLVRAAKILAKESKASSTELPVQGTPTDFLSDPWRTRAVVRYGRTDEILKIRKAQYELGWCRASEQAFKKGHLAVIGAQRFAPMTDHLLDREAFFDAFAEHAEKLKLPQEAGPVYDPLRARLINQLGVFAADYTKNQSQCWMKLDGSLSFSRAPGKRETARLKKLNLKLAPFMPEVSILEVLLDAHRWTGYIDCFEPVSGRQNMGDSEKLRHVLAALYAYGCNCGPCQAARSTGLEPNQVAYMRRHYMGIKQLIDAAAILADAYGRTAVAKRLGGESVLSSDAMHVRTLENSLTARPYYRDMSNKNVLLYQHVTGHCVCQFTQALLCNVSEAIHMLHGVLQCQRGQAEPLICICDSGGISDLVFGLASLLNIRLYPRVSSGHLKLWAPAQDMMTMSDLPGPLMGPIRWDWIDEGWRDMVWILASIAAGTASPLVIFERLAAQQDHPATRGFQELGKLERTCYLLEYGTDMALREFVVPHTARREHWNSFSRNVLAFGDLIREKDKTGQEEVFWCLTVIQNAIVLWNALAMDRAVKAAREQGINIRDKDLAHLLPTLLRHINFVGLFDVNLRRRPPFAFASGNIQ